MSLAVSSGSLLPLAPHHRLNDSISKSEAWSEVCCPSNCNAAANAQALQDKFFRELFRDCLGYAGAVIIRRILGIAHVIDYESIKDADARCVCFPHQLDPCRVHISREGDEGKCRRM